MISAMNVSPAVLDQAVGLLDLIALVRDPGASKAVLEEFVAQRVAAEKAQSSALKIQAETSRQLDELRVFQQKCLDDEARVNAARDACAVEQEKLSDARDDAERGRAEIKQSKRDVTLALEALAGQREALNTQQLNNELTLTKQREQIGAEQRELDVRSAEIEAAAEALNVRLAKFRALAGE